MLFENEHRVGETVAVHDAACGAHGRIDDRFRAGEMLAGERDARVRIFRPDRPHHVGHAIRNARCVFEHVLGGFIDRVKFRSPAVRTKQDPSRFDALSVARKPFDAGTPQFEKTARRVESRHDPFRLGCGFDNTYRIADPEPFGRQVVVRAIVAKQSLKVRIREMHVTPANHPIGKFVLPDGKDAPNFGASRIGSCLRRASSCREAEERPGACALRSPPRASSRHR